MGWLDGYLPVISTLATVGSLLVWMFYARLLYVGFRHHERPLILIHQAQGHGLGSSCLVINLSREPVHIALILLVVRVGDHTITLHMSDYRRITTGKDKTGGAAESIMKEGPLHSGDFLSLGDLHGMLEACRGRPDDGQEKGSGGRSFDELVQHIEGLEVRIVAHYSAFSNPIGARQRYRVRHTDGDTYLKAETLLTEQLCSYRGRRMAYGWLRDALK